MTLNEDEFAYLLKRPPALSHFFYCSPCFDAEVAPAKEHYEQVSELAREVLVYFVTQKTKLPLVKKSKDVIRVDDCEDRDLTILKLAYAAADQGYNAIVETDVNSEKLRHFGYQKSRWSGTARAAQIDVAKLGRYD